MLRGLTASNRRRSYVERMGPFGTVRRLAGSARQGIAVGACSLCFAGLVGTRVSRGPDMSVSRMAAANHRMWYRPVQVDGERLAMVTTSYE